MENTMLNLTPAAYLPEIHISQYDIGRTITFTLKDGAGDYTVPSGATVTVKATKPSGFGFDVACTFSGGTVTLVTTETMTLEHGRFPAELSIVSGTTTLGTSNFIFNIERSPHPEGTVDGDASTIIPQLTLLVERIEAAAESVDENTTIAVEAKNTAVSAKDTAVSAMNTTVSAKDTAVSAKESAEASATAAANSAQEAEETLDSYAKVDGYYEDLTSGSAEQLLSDQYVEDKTPYNFRTSGGSSDIGNRKYVNSIVGGSVVWNQLMPISTVTTSTVNGITLTNNNDGSWKVSGTATADANKMIRDNTQNFLTSGHKYAFLGFSGTGLVRLYDSYSGRYSSNTDAIFAYTNTSNARGQFTIKVASGVTVNETIRPMFIDLTQMFGSTVADYIYSLEQSQSGKGVEYFKRLFPKSYYPYNSGELMSVKTDYAEMVGFNQWDEEWELGTIGSSSGADSSASDRIRTKNYIPVIGGQVYYSTIATRFLFYDGDKNYLGIDSSISLNNAGTFTVPNNAMYMRFGLDSSYGTTYKNDICINLSWSGTHNGEYEAYKKHTYELSPLELRGIPKLDSSNNLYYDGDTYEADGTVTRRYGVVDLGSLSWTYTAMSNNRSCFYTDIASLKIPATTEPLNAICSKFQAVSLSASWVDGTMFNQNVNLHRLGVICNAYTDATSFKTAMSGVYLVYELASPTTEEANPYTNPMQVDDWGTERFNDYAYDNGDRDVEIPVGHLTDYPPNMVDKLNHLPSLADSDGYYMIKQTGTEMSLELFRIPKAPTTDGTYQLKATVSGGTPTYTWEVVE